MDSILSTGGNLKIATEDIYKKQSFSNIDEASRHFFRYILHKVKAMLFIQFTLSSFCEEQYYPR